MKVADAYTMAIDCLREHGADTKEARAAIKILEGKYQKLRLRAEVAAVAKQADLSIFEDAYTGLSPERILEIRRIYEGRMCENCKQGKAQRVGFCVVRCWPRLPAKVRHAMHTLGMGDGWEGAYQCGFEFLQLHDLHTI